MEINITAKLNRTCFPHSARHDDVSAALFGKLFDGFVESLRTIGFSVWHSAVLGDVNRGGREFYLLHAFDLDGQVGVIMVVLTLRACEERCAQQEGGEEDLFLSHEGTITFSFHCIIVLVFFRDYGIT